MPSVDTDIDIEPKEPQTLPWHDLQWSTLTRSIDHLPHALLLHGQVGVGKEVFAARLAQFLLCLKRRPDNQACDRCHSCALFCAGNHPDFLRVAPLEDSSMIVVDQIRGVIEFLSLKAHTSQHKIVVVSPAQTMNVNAANSLLKVLEEPPPGNLLILVAPHLSRVPMTIRSRCVRVPIQAPPLPQALTWLRSQTPEALEPEAWLSLAGGGPLAALALAKEQGKDHRPELLADLTALAMGRADPMRCAEHWKSIGTELCLEWLYRFIVDAVRQRYRSTIRNPKTTLPGLPETLFIYFIDLFQFVDSISILKKQLGTGVDETLALEDLLIRWCEITTRAV